jgi:uncharacterized protein DUF4397
MTRRLLTTVVLAALAAVLSVVAAQPASAATGTYLRLAHLSPDTPAVDVLVTSFSGETIGLAGVGYGDVSSYQRIQPGTYTVQMRLAGADPTSPPVVSGTLQAEEGAAYTAAGLGPRAQLAVNVLADDLTPPAAGQARIRVVQGAELAGDVAVGWDGAPVADGVRFGTATDYYPVPAGRGTFDVTPAGGAPVPVDLDLAGGGVYSVILVQRDGVLGAELQTDAVGPGSAPAGGIDTGLGGTAAGAGTPAAAATPVVVGALAALGLVGAGALTRRVRADRGR